MQKGIALLEPVLDAQLDSIRASRVKAMDETRILAGRQGPGKMQTSYFWPVYGEQDEICFLTGEAKRKMRLAHAKPVATRFFDGIDKQFEAQGFLPSGPFMKALAYIRERRDALSVYLEDPEVRIDTNHLERALRVIPMGRAIGCLAGPNWAPNTSALCKVCWSLADCTILIRMTISSMCCSARANILLPECMN